MWKLQEIEVRQGHLDDGVYSSDRARSLLLTNYYLNDRNFVVLMYYAVVCSDNDLILTFTVPVSLSNKQV